MHASPVIGFILTFFVNGVLAGEVLPLPPRKPDAPTGSRLLERIKLAPLDEREAVLLQEILAGNVPTYLRALCPVTVQATIGGEEVGATIHVTPDYLAVGHDDDFLLTPLRPATAQKIADRLDCILPTPTMVDAIYRSAPLKLPPHPLRPSSAMTTFPVMAEHSRIIGLQRRDALVAHPFGTLTAGHKKDVVLVPSLRDLPGKVAIYGWHRLNASPIQPLYTGHTAEWVDYSHGIRLVSQNAVLAGKPHHLPKVLADPHWSLLFSPEGPIETPRYPTIPAEEGFR